MSEVSVTASGVSGNPQLESVRIDQWVWAARLVKTRSQGTAACKAGHIKINGDTVKPSAPVRVEDIVTSTRHQSEKIYRVIALGTKRGSAVVAAGLFEDLTPPPLPKPERPMDIIREPGTGRPTKRERRQLDALRGFMK